MRPSGWAGGAWGLDRASLILLALSVSVSIIVHPYENLAVNLAANHAEKVFFAAMRLFLAGWPIGLPRSL